MLVELSPADRQLLRQIILSVDTKAEAQEARETAAPEEHPISQSRYLENSARWLEFAVTWQRRLNDGFLYQTPELRKAFEMGLSFGYEAAVRPYIKIENPSAVSE